MRIALLLLMLLLLQQSSFAQDNFPDVMYEQANVLFGYKRNLQEVELSEEYKKGYKQLSLLGKIEDSFSVYVDDELLFSDTISYDRKQGVWFSKVYSLGKIKKKFHWVTVIFYESRTYIELPVDLRYSFIELHQVGEKDNFFWQVTYSNSPPK